ncbi:MAG: hypothetical protein AAF403_03600 [Pseudomonadota bacterium]
MTTDIALSVSQRNVLLSLQRTQSLADRSQERLSTGRKVNSVVDDSITFFRAKSLTDVATDFNALRASIDQGINAINVFSSAVQGIENLVNQLRGLAEQQRSTSTAQRQSATRQFSTIGNQIHQLIEDARFNGVNLLARTTAELEIRFGTRTASRLQIGGLDLNATRAVITTGNPTGAQVRATNVLFSGRGTTIAIFDANGNITLSAIFTLAGGFTAVGANNSLLSFLENGIGHLERAVDRIRGHATYLGNSVSILNVRLTYTSSYVSELNSASDKLTLADLNEEGANLVALQTRQQLGIQALSFSGQTLRAIITLLQ